MTAHAYSEHTLVEQPAIGLFAALGWQTVSAMEETFGAGSTSSSRVIIELACTIDGIWPTMPSARLELPSFPEENHVQTIQHRRSEQAQYPLHARPVAADRH
jgi:hypothetical protein